MARLAATTILSILAIVLYHFLGFTWASFTAGSLGALLLYGWWEDGYFRRRGVKSTPTWVPFFGHVLPSLFQIEHATVTSRRIYNTFPKERYVGLRQFTRPLVMITDLELIKQITVKDFDNFQDHAGVIDEKTDPLFGNALGALRGQKWRDMRATLSPAFTSSKMKGMFQFIVECGEEMITYLEAEVLKPESRSKGYFEIEMKDVFTRYANDVIASSAFGIKVNSLKNRDNEFYTMGKRATNFSGLALLKIVFLMFAPKIMKILRFTALSPEASAFFRSLVLDTMKSREEQNIMRPDMIQLLMQAKKGSLEHDEKNEESKETGFATVEESALGKESIKRKWTDDEIVAQAVIFFLAGFDGISNLLCFVVHELAINSEIQQKLQDEVDEVAAKNNGKVSYADLHSMKYMDMVISETLRHWPQATSLDRKCVQTYTLPPPNEASSKGYTLKCNDGIIIPIYDIHHDPKFYENPEKFDPERFFEENRGSINPLAYLPFGIGPRNCIGSRFALMETKVIIFQIMQKFNLVSTSKTSNPMKIKKSSINFIAENGFWVGLKSRDV